MAKVKEIKQQQTAQCQEGNLEPGKIKYPDVPFFSCQERDEGKQYTKPGYQPDRNNTKFPQNGVCLMIVPQSNTNLLNRTNVRY